MGVGPVRRALPFLMLRHLSSPLRLFAGSGCLSHLRAELARAGCSRVVVLGSPSLAESPVMASVVAACGEACVATLADARQNAPRQAVEHLRDAIRAVGADGVVAVGGGSVMVSARAALILLAEDKPLETLCTRIDQTGQPISPRLSAPKLPIFAVPTTPTTAVAKAGSAVSDGGHRRTLFDPKTRPAAIFLEPAGLDGTPEAVINRALANTLVSTVEGLLAATDPLAEGQLRQALRLLGPDRSRQDQAIAAILCAQGTDHTGLGLATVLSHALTAVTGLEGGTAKAIVLPHVLPLCSPDGLARLADGWGCPAADLPDCLSFALRRVEPMRRLQDCGLAKNSLAAVADACLQDWFFRAAPTSRDQILSVLRAAW